MISNLSGVLKIAPLLVMRIPLLSIKRLSDAARFNLELQELPKTASVADKLRWNRYHKGLVAGYIGIDQATYTRYEEADRDFYPVEHLTKLAEFYEVPLEEFLDEYSLFICNGQGKQVVAARKKLKMTQKQFADKLGVNLGALKNWEQDRVKMQKSTWEKYFK